MLNSETYIDMVFCTYNLVWIFGDVDIDIEFVYLRDLCMLTDTMLTSTYTITPSPMGL